MTSRKRSLQKGSITPMGQSVRASFFATTSGGLTLDRDRHGGNPFASALIELIHDSSLRLPAMPMRLRDLTIQTSGGTQFPDHRAPLDLPDWSFQKELIPRAETRDALVLVVSDYTASPPLASLQGAAWDERRVSAILAQNGFSVTQGIAPSRNSLLRSLAAVKRRSAYSDVAIIYSTGHGIEIDGEVFLIPGDYPAALGYNRSQLRKSAVRVTTIDQSAQAKLLNLIFFAGCRKLPKERTNALITDHPHNP